MVEVERGGFGETKSRISCFSAQNSTCLIRSKVFESLTHVSQPAFASVRLCLSRIYRGAKLLDFKVQTGTTPPLAAAAVAAATNDNFVSSLFGNASRTSHSLHLRREFHSIFRDANI